MNYIFKKKNYFNLQFITVLSSFFSFSNKKGINYNSPGLPTEQMSASKVAVLIQTYNYTLEGPGQSILTKIMNLLKMLIYM